MAHIFICYRREDASGHAGRLFDRLVDNFGKKNIFYDISSIGVGTKWTDKIKRELEDCKVFLAVIGKKWYTERLKDPEDYLRREIAYALDHDALVVPILVDSAEIPRAKDMPTDITGLLQQQAFSLDDKSHAAYLDDVKRLTETIEAKLSERTEEEPLERIVHFNPSLEIVVEPETVMEIRQIPEDSEVVSIGRGLHILGLVESSPGSKQWTWGALCNTMPEEFKEVFLNDLTQRILAGCQNRKFKTIVKRVRAVHDQCDYIIIVNRARQESEGMMSFEIVFIKDPVSE